MATLAVGLYVARSRREPLPPRRTEAIVEIRSGTLVAFDFPSEAVRYRLSGFVPGRYKVPLAAVSKATDEDEQHHPETMILVDTATIMLVDADFEGKLRVIEDRLFAEVNACPSVIHRQAAVVEELGIRFDYLDVDGDGAYILDVSRIERVP